MLLRNLILATLLCGVFGASYDFDQVASFVDRGLKYLETSYPDYKVSENCTHALAWGVVEYYAVQLTTKNIPANRLEALLAFIERFMPFIRQTLADNPDDEDLQVFLHPEVWPETGDYSFVPGRIPTGVFFLRSLYQIYERSIPSEASDACNTEVIADNLASNSLRTCSEPCDPEMYDTNMETGFAPDERITYLASLAILNCSNETPVQRLSRVNTICKYIMKQANTMYRQRNTTIFEDIRYYYLEKIFVCAVYGFPEFICYPFVNQVVGSMNCDGSVGTDSNSDEDKCVLTAQSIGILSSVLRLSIEETSQGKKLLNCSYTH